MKKLKYIVLFVLSVVILQSCYDDTPLDYSLNGNEEVVQATLTIPRDFTAEEDRVTFTVNIDKTFDSDVTLVVELELNDRRKTRKNITMPAGSTSIANFIYMPASDGLYSFPPTQSFQDYVKVRVVGILVDQPQEGVLYSISSNEVLLDMYIQLPEILEEGGISYVFVWDTNKTDDYDIISDLSDLTSATGNPIEEASITNASFSDGTYMLSYNPYAIAAVSDVNYLLFIRVTNSDNTDTLLKFTGTLDAVNNDPGAIYDLLSFDRTTVDNVSTYTFTQLED